MLTVGLEHGIDVRGNMTNSITTAVSSLGSSAASVMTSEYGAFGKGKVGLAEQARLSKNPLANQPTPVSKGFDLTTMSTETKILYGFGALFVLWILSKFLGSGKR